MSNLTRAIHTYNSFGYRLFMDTPAFHGLLAARNRHFRRKVLLVNLRAAAINALLERVFTRAAASLGRELALDVYHSFDAGYDLFTVPNGTGFRVRDSGLDNLKQFVAGTRYDACVFLDLPYWEQGFMPYIWLAMAGGAAQKHFIANDNLLAEGHLFSVDLAQRLRLFDALDTACVVNQHSVREWGRFGRPKRGFTERDYAVDCSYYEPSGSTDGGYLLSCGHADRDYGALFRALELCGPCPRLKIYTEAGLAVPARLKRRVEIVPYSADSGRMKELVAGASCVVLPVRPSAPNPGAGLSVALLSMAMGKVVLTSGNACVHRYLEDGVSAFTYRELTPRSLAAGLRRVLALPPAGKAAVCAAARRAVLRRNDMNPFVESYLAGLLKGLSRS